VTNARVDALAAAALRGGALAAKVCGAGGGGCMVALAPDASDARLVREVKGAGGTPIPFRPAAEGVRIG
jgi:mevalonate kinase